MTTTPDRARVRGALFGLAIGDALGWPQEQNADNLDGRPEQPELAFRAWRRRSGHWRQSYEETIGPGHYSDDTQLTLCVARSRLRGADWFEHLTRVELPAWATYQRGGGGAVLRAAKSWAKGRAPWSGTTDEVARYFKAGANGVAMRALPHTVFGVRNDDFDATRRAVLRDGLTTHGHPRALVGALAYASALRTCLTLDHTLGHGELLATTIANAETWGSFDRATLPGDWADAHDRSIGNTETAWNNTRDEMLQLLELAHEGVQRGPLADDFDVLARLGAFERSTNGAGTVSAAAAIFAASRFADSPERALLLTAFLERADTDTLASMTGALLGAIDTDDRMAGLGRTIQDREYLEGIAERLCNDKHNVAPLSSVPPVAAATTKIIDRWTRSLADLADGTETEFPDGRPARLVEHTSLPSRSSDREVRRYTLRTADGQTLFVTKSSKRAEPPADDRVIATMVGVRVFVPELEPVRQFYESVLGLTPTVHRNRFVKYGESLAIEVPPDCTEVPQPGPSIIDVPRLEVGETPESESDPTATPPDAESPASQPGRETADTRPGFVVHVEAADVEAVHRAVVAAGSAIASELITDRDGRMRFTCVDPSGHLVEVVAPRQTRGRRSR